MSSVTSLSLGSRFYGNLVIRSKWNTPSYTSHSIFLPKSLSSLSGGIISPDSISVSGCWVRSGDITSRLATVVVFAVVTALAVIAAIYLLSDCSSSILDFFLALSSLANLEDFQTDASACRGKRGREVAR